MTPQYLPCRGLSACAGKTEATVTHQGQSCVAGWLQFGLHSTADEARRGRNPHQDVASSTTRSRVHESERRMEAVAGGAKPGTGIPTPRLPAFQIRRL